jgi:hypothetical protein
VEFIDGIADPIVGPEKFDFPGVTIDGPWFSLFGAAIRSSASVDRLRANVATAPSPAPARWNKPNLPLRAQISVGDRCSFTGYLTEITA